jgi:CheY-like chemotaxis protein
MSEMVAGPADPLHGIRILVIEDEFLITLLVEDMLRKAGILDVVTAVSFEQAHELLTHEDRVDAVVIDLKLHEQADAGIVLAEVAAKRDIPFVFATAYERNNLALPAHLRHAPLLNKPYRPPALIGALREVTSRQRLPKS